MSGDTGTMKKGSGMHCRTLSSRENTRAEGLSNCVPASLFLEAVWLAATWLEDEDEGESWRYGCNQQPVFSTSLLFFSVESQPLQCFVGMTVLLSGV